MLIVISLMIVAIATVAMITWRVTKEPAPKANYALIEKLEHELELPHNEADCQICTRKAEDKRSQDVTKMLSRHQALTTAQARETVNNTWTYKQTVVVRHGKQTNR